MKRFMRIGLAAIVAIVVAVVVFYLMSNLNALVAQAIEKHGSEATETRVRVSGVDISLREGRGSLEGLRVASPEGFAAADAFSLGEITVDIDVGSVREDPVVIEEIRVKAPVVRVEITKTGESNIKVLRERVQAYAPEGASGGNVDGAARRIAIKWFVFEEGRIEVDATALGLERRTIPLPEISLRDVGGTDGVTPGELAKTIISTMARRATSEIAGSEIDRLIEKELGGSVVDKAKELFKKIGR